MDRTKISARKRLFPEFIGLSTPNGYILLVKNEKDV